MKFKSEFQQMIFANLFGTIIQSIFDSSTIPFVHFEGLVINGPL